MNKMGALAGPLIPLLFIGAAVAAPPKRIPRCPGGRFVPETAVVTGSAPTDVLVVDDSSKTITIGANCGPSKVRLKATKKGTVVRGSFRRCADLKGRVRLKATIQPECDRMVGTLKAAKGKPKLRSFSATRATGCGDSLVDGLMGEHCERDGDCSGGSLCAGCLCVTTTTSTTSTSTSTSTVTTIPCANDSDCPPTLHCRVGLCKQRRPAAMPTRTSVAPRASVARRASTTSASVGEIAISMGRSRLTSSPLRSGLPRASST